MASDREAGLMSGPICGPTGEPTRLRPMRAPLCNYEQFGLEILRLKFEDTKAEGRVCGLKLQTLPSCTVHIIKQISSSRQMVLGRCNLSSLPAPKMECIVFFVSQGKISIRIGTVVVVVADHVYKAVKTNFSISAWIIVSSSYQVEDLLKQIASELGVAIGVTNTNRNLVEVIHNQLQGSKYLIVLDDVWHADLWFKIRNAFPTESTGRFVITTRIQEVALLATENCTIELAPLQREYAWQLFCNEAFWKNENKTCPEELENLAQMFLGKCGGLPIAIACVGRLLSCRHPTYSQWESLYKELELQLSNNMILDVNIVLKLSLEDLPTDLKNCFLHCTIFPEGRLFGRKRLIRHWIAAGYIKEAGSKTLEEVAAGYLNELVNRSLLQVVQRNPCGRVRRCRMHDIIRVLALAKSEEECFCQVYNGSRPFSNENTRRLSVQSTNMELLTPLMCATSLRSLHVFVSHLRIDSLEAFLKPFKLLSTLDLQGVRIKRLPEMVFNLFNMLFLGLRETLIEYLPKEIGRLQNLEVLDAYFAMLSALPVEVTTLWKLKYLYVVTIPTGAYKRVLTFEGIQVPKGIGSLTDLLALQAIEVSNEVLYQLGCLTKLRGAAGLPQPPPMRPEGGAEPVRPRRARSVQGENGSSDLRPGEGSHQGSAVHPGCRGVEGSQVEPPGCNRGSTQQGGVEATQRRFLGLVRHELDAIHLEHPDGVAPTTVGSGGVEVAGVLVPLRHRPALPTLTPVGRLPRNRGRQLEPGVTPPPLFGHGKPPALLPEVYLVNQKLAVVIENRNEFVLSFSYLGRKPEAFLLTSEAGRGAGKRGARVQEGKTEGRNPRSKSHDVSKKKRPARGRRVETETKRGNRRERGGHTFARPSEQTVRERQLMPSQSIDHGVERAHAPDVEAVIVFLPRETGEIKIAHHEPWPVDGRSQSKHVGNERRSERVISRGVHVGDRERQIRNGRRERDGEGEARLGRGDPRQEPGIPSSNDATASAIRILSDKIREGAREERSGFRSAERRKFDERREGIQPGFHSPGVGGWVLHMSKDGLSCEGKTAAGISKDGVAPRAVSENSATGIWFPICIYVGMLLVAGHAHGSWPARVQLSRRCRVGLQSAPSAAGSRSGRAVGRGAGRSGRAVGLRGFASPDVLKYRLAVFGIPVANSSDSSPRASGQLGKVGRRFLGSNMVLTWHLRGTSMGLTWHLLGANMASTWRQHGL
uniref:Disease resistance protein n=1 Tax=Triticum aestivum TaxID=4565 RepID=A0A0B4SVQ6_WHEAT|nr:disease resistance protein [Triticum aestivum]